MTGMAWSGAWSVTHDLTAEEAAIPFWRDLLDEASDGSLKATVDDEPATASPTPKETR